MRVLLTAALALACLAPAVGEDKGAGDPKPVNTVCPCPDGGRVDPRIPPVEATTADGKTVYIGVSDARCRALVAKDPSAYVDAAVHNRTTPRP